MIDGLLHLTLHRKWFCMILSGEKKEEYRDIKPYWDTRLNNKRFTQVYFKNGYGPTRPWMIVEIKEHLTGFGKVEWGAPLSVPVHILRLGNILDYGHGQNQEETE